MKVQRRTQLLVGGLFLAAVALVAVLLFTNQAPGGSPATLSPVVTPQSAEATDAAASSAAQSAATALTVTEPTVAGQAQSPLAVAGVAAVSPLATPSHSVGQPVDQSVEMTPTAAPTATPTVTPVPTPAPPVRSGAAGIPIYGYEIVAAYPHDPNAFTQGLQIIDGELFEGTGLYGKSSLRRVELETGEVLQQIDLAADLFGEGIAVVGERIYQLTWQEQRGFIYDRETFERTDEFRYETEGWGLTFDGEHLVMSDGTNRLFWRDPVTLAVERQVDVVQSDVPVSLLNELEYVDGEIYANVWQSDWIVRIDPETGQVVGWVDLTGLLDGIDLAQPVDVLNGIAYDAENERLFVTGKLWPRLFEIRLVER